MALRTTLRSARSRWAASAVAVTAPCRRRHRHRHARAAAMVRMASAVSRTSPARSTRREAQLLLVGVDARQREQVVDDGAHAVDLFEAAVHRLAQLVGLLRDRRAPALAA